MIASRPASALRARPPARCALLAALGLLAAAPVSAAPLRLPISVRMEASTTWAENINRASSPADWTDTLRHEARATASLLTPLATGISVINEVDLGYTSTPRYTRTDTVSVSARTALRWKFGLGAFAPVLTTDVALARRASRIDGDDSWLATSTLHASKRFTDTVRASVTGDWSQNYAASSTFDTRHHRLFGTLTWDITDRWQLTYGRGSLWGDITANASARIWGRALAGLISPAIGAYYPTLSYQTTDSYGPGYVTYRLKARTDFWWLELAPALGPNTSLPLRYESTFTVNFVGVKYRQDIWTLGLLHRF